MSEQGNKDSLQKNATEIVAKELGSAVENSMGFSYSVLSEVKQKENKNPNSQDSPKIPIIIVREKLGQHLVSENDKNHAYKFRKYRL